MPASAGKTIAFRFGIEQHSLEADPQFADPGKDVLRLGNDSPAQKLGFEPIDLSGAEGGQSA